MGCSGQRQAKVIELTPVIQEPLAATQPSRPRLKRSATQLELQRSQSISSFRVQTLADFNISSRTLLYRLPSTPSLKAMTVTTEETLVSLSLEPTEVEEIDLLFGPAEYPLFILEASFNALATAKQEFRTATSIGRRELTAGVIVMLTLVLVEQRVAGLSLEFPADFPYLQFKSTAVLHYKAVLGAWQALVAATTRVKGQLSKLNSLLQPIADVTKKVEVGLLQHAGSFETESNLAILKNAPNVFLRIRAQVTEVDEQLKKASQRLMDATFYYIVKRIAETSKSVLTATKLVQMCGDELFI